MYRLTILYGKPDDMAAFRTYYEDVHIPIARRMSGLTGWNLSWIDEDPDEPDRFCLVAELYAPSKEAMDVILASPEGQAASADLDNFVTGGVVFLGGEEVEVRL